MVVNRVSDFACGAITGVVLWNLVQFMLLARRHRSKPIAAAARTTVAEEMKVAQREGGTLDASKSDWVSVVSSPLDMQSLIARVASPKAGAIVTFSGVTRNNFNGREVVRLEYEGFESMAEREMAKVCREMREKWDIIKVAMVHRTGVCPVQEASVIIAVSSAHRRDALEAAHFGIDRIKATAPIWKKEFYADANNPSAWKENKEWHDERKRR